MAFAHGKDAVILVDGVALSAYFNSLEVNAEVETAETTTFGASWKSFIAGQASMTADMSGYFDPTQTAIWATIGDYPGAVVTICPGGAAAGAPTRVIPSITSSYSETADIGDAVTFDWSIASSGEIETGYVLAALDEVTEDQNGDAIDGGAATTDGGVASLHVTSVSASDSIVVTIEDSANGTSGWATIGTFASKSAAGAEVIYISGTIRRYVRVVDNVTGSDVSITRTVALSRR